MTSTNTPNHALSGAPPTRPVAPVSQDERRISEFLAHHNPPCPHCGYQLFGLTASTCPECGSQLILGIMPGTYATPYVPLHWPCLTGVIAGLVGAMFATFIRREHDDWMVGVVIALASSGMALPLWLFRKQLALMPRRLTLTLSIVLWIALILATCAAFFLDI